MAVIAGCAWSGPGPEWHPSPTPPDGWSQRVRIVRDLCAELGIPAPGPVEVLPTPDDTAGVTFAAMIRLQPEDLDMRTATLMHEAGHLGVARGHDVEEAIADLTRRALVLHWLELDPVAAAPLVPWLLQGLGPGSERAGPPAADPARLYARATRLALALLRATPSTGSTAGGMARRCAAAVRTARSLSSDEVRALADRLLPPRDVERARDEEMLAVVLPALRVAAAAVPDDAATRSFLLDLGRVLEIPDRPWHTLVQRAGTAAPAGPFARVLFAILAEQDRDAARRHLEAWERAARGAADDDGRSAALSRLAALHGVDGDRPRADAAALTLLLESRDAASAAFALTLLHRRSEPAHEPIGQFLDLAPALRAPTAGTAAIRAQVLASLGDPAAAVAEFSRAASTDPSWFLVRDWASSLAAAGRPGRAVALLDADARSARRRGDRARAGSSLLAAVLLVDDDRERRAAAAAELLDSGPAAPDQALALAARAAEASGRPEAARRAWRRLLARAPGSDYAAEAREALAASGHRQP